MREEKLYEAITLIGDDLIDETAGYTPKRKRTIPWKRWTVLAACLVLVVGAVSMGGRILPSLSGSDSGDGNSGGGSSDGGGSGSKGGSTFMSYAGPIFPLTALEETNGLTAERDVTLDFLPWASAPYSADIRVTDSYTLTNTTGENKTVTLLYPFASGLWALDERRPILTVDGTEPEAELLIGPYSGGFWGTAEAPEKSYNLDEISSWEEYRALLEDGSYLEKALSAFPDLSGTDVVVYKFTDPKWAEKSDNISNLSFRVMFDLDYDKTTVLSYNFNAGYYDRESGMMGKGSSVPQAWQPGYGQPCYLILLGGDAESMEVSGYTAGGWDTAAKLDEFSIDVERYETDLGAALREVAGCLYDGLSRQSVDFETYYGLLCDYLLTYGGGVDRYSEGRLEDYWDVYAVDRVCYLQTGITIPAGESVTVCAEMTQPASFDHDCVHTENKDVYGYDLVTRLGSALTFAGQTATLEDHGVIGIVRQNFGFDLEQGIKTVTLDLDTGHYYLEVKRLK